MVFTSEQKKIFEFVAHGHGHGIIDAVAGAGKTSTIIECANYVQDKSKILFCAFNNSISREILSKFRTKGNPEVAVKTIHSLGLQILRDNNNSGKEYKLENKKYKNLLEGNQLQQKLKPYFQKILSINGYDFDIFDGFEDHKDFGIKNYINKIKVRLLEINQKYRATLTKDNIGDFTEMVKHFGIFNKLEVEAPNFREEIQSYYDCHKIFLLSGNEFSRSTLLIDFTDMLYLPYCWKFTPAQKFELLFIDECQDLSMSQFAVATKFCKIDGRILAVGDPKQSIYGFTGADIKSFENVKKFTQAEQLPLTVCFRCPQKVIDLAKEIRKDIVGAKDLQGIVEDLSYDSLITKAKPNDLIICRLREPILLLVFAFIDRNIKVKIHEDEVNEIINDLKEIFKIDETDISISNLQGGFEALKDRILYRWKYIIQKKSERILDNDEKKQFIRAENDLLIAKLDFLYRKYQLWKEDGIDTIKEIILKIKDFISASNDAIKLSTIHRAKGLENDRVFILNYDDLPYYRMEQKDWEKTQEDNLKYVAM